MLMELEWEDLPDRRREARLVMFYKIMNGLGGVNMLKPMLISHLDQSIPAPER